MKKIICAAAACALMLTGAVGCGKDDKSSNGASGSGFEGKWECASMDFGGMSLTSIPIVNVPLSAAFQLEINSDGTFDVTSGIVGEIDGFSSEDESGEWEKVDDTTIKIKNTTAPTDESTTGEDDGSDSFLGAKEVELKLENDQLVAAYEENGQQASVKFNRVSEFSTYEATTMSEEDASKMLETFSFEMETEAETNDD